uniref:SUEL-type lectin domain-containing protein n=1 Tax=Caenorhabditis japonica TaxID=281687 RepID=A0A8R1DGN0_CAEJA
MRVEKCASTESAPCKFYGRVVTENQLCPPQAGRKAIDSLSHHSNTCDVIQAHTRISELCDKRRKCTLVVDANTFEDDPCPTTSKYLQMTYGCIPVSFEEQTFCTQKKSEPADVRLECREGRRLAIYSAQVKTTAKCSDGLEEQDVNEEIFSEEAITGKLTSLEEYIKNVEERPMTKNEEPYSKPTSFETILDETRPGTDFLGEIANDASYVAHDEYRQESQSPPLTESVEPNLVGVSHDLMQVFEFLKENKEKTILCVILSISTAAIVTLCACIVARLCSSSKSRRSRSSSRSRKPLEPSKMTSSNYCSSNLQDLEDEQFLRFSMGSSPQPISACNHYDL